MSSPSYQRFLEACKGKRVKTLKGLYDAGEKKRSVFVPSLEWFQKPQAAAFVMNYQGHILHRLFESGMWVYKKPKSHWGKAPWLRP